MKRLHQAGFSLVEILLVLGILVLITVVMIDGFSSYAYRQVLTQFSSGVRDELIEARQQTIASFKNTTYGVYVGTSTIEFFPGAMPEVGSSTNTIIAIPEQIVATSSFSTGDWYLTFHRLTGEATATGTITMFDTRTVATSTITISASGLVE